MNESHFERQCADMIASQIRGRGIRDERVLAAMLHVPRHLFVPDDKQANAYEDRPLSIGQGQTISQPYMVAVMTALLALGPEDRVLEIGTGSGYQAAILSRLASEVISIERIPGLAADASRRLAELRCQNVRIRVGDGTLGYPESAPYDAIVVTAAGPEIPAPLKEQLAPGGRLVCPVGTRDTQRLVRLIHEDQGFREESGTACLFVPLIGEGGWPD